MRFGRKTLSIIVSALLLVTGFFLPSNIAEAATATYSTSGVSLPSNMYVGSSFVVKGVVKSNLKITSVKAGVVNSSGTWMKGSYGTATPNNKSYNLNNLDSKIAFGKLAGGTYNYRVWVKVSNGATKYVVNKKFTITSMKVTSASYPKNIYKGKAISIKGTVASKYKLSYVRAGVTTAAKKWVSGAYKTVNPKVKSYNLKNMDSSIAISKLPAGTYYYYIQARDSKNGTTTLLKKKFTVSAFSVSSVSKPTALSTGSGFVVKGNVKSKHKLNYVRAGVKNSSGNWKSGSYANTNPSSTGYSLSKLDSKIKFGSLSKGTYYYSVWVRDVNGISKTMVNQKFTVGGGSGSGSNTISGSTALLSGGKILSYNSSLISSTIGAQQVSGPCGIYAMAYARAVMDGKFTKGNYSSVYSRLINQYGHGTYCAYWSEAGGDSCYYSSATSCYKVALQQIAKGKPCIINLYNRNTGNQHYVCVIGYVAGTSYSNVSLSKFIALDPGYGTKKYLSTMNYSNNGSPQCITF